MCPAWTAAAARSAAAAARSCPAQLDSQVRCGSELPDYSRRRCSATLGSDTKEQMKAEARQTCHHLLLSAALLLPALPRCPQSCVTCADQPLHRCMPA